MPCAGLCGMSGTDEERSHNEEQKVALEMWCHPAPFVRGCLTGQASLFCGMKLLILLNGCRGGSALVPLRNCSIFRIIFSGLLSP